MTPPEFKPPRVPRIPPGFFGRYNLLWLGSVLFGLVWCSAWAYHSATMHQTGFVIFQSAALALNIMNAGSFVMSWAGHWRKWTADRARMLEMIAATQAEVERILREHQK
jgi:hypothetical protein